MTNQRYRIELHTLTGDVHATDWDTMTQEQTTTTAASLTAMLDGPVRLRTATGAHVAVPLAQIASVRIVPEEPPAHE